MPKQKEGKTKVTLIPPRVSVSKLSTKYDLVIDVAWGEYVRQLKISKEYGQLVDKTIDEINQALAEACELTQPYLIHD